MRTRKGISAIESVVFVCLISSGFLLFMTRVPGQVIQPIEETRDTSRHSLARVTTNDSAPTQSIISSVRSYSHWVPTGMLISIALLLVYLRHHLSQQETSVTVTILKQLKQQTQNRNGKLSARMLEKQKQIIRAFSGDSKSFLRNEIVAGDIMSISPTFVSPETPKHRLVAQMRSSEMHHLMVCDDSGKLVGIISDRDLRKKNCLSAEEMMTADPYTTDINSDINNTISLMLVNRISCIPVLDGKNLVGVISSSDIAATLQCTLSLLNSLFSPEEQDPAKNKRHAKNPILIHANA